MPNTYIIGVQKAGTTSLHGWLAQHPDIYAPLELKDVDYFANPEIANNAKERLMDDFAGHKGEQIILHSYVNYIIYKEALKRIKKLNPETKLIVILRDPADRAISAYKYFKKMDIENRNIESALLYRPKKNLTYSKSNCDFTYIEHGFYGQQLENTFKIFNSQKVLVLSFKELTSEPEKLVKKVFKFLKVDDNFIPKFKKRNHSGKIRFEWLHKKLISTSKVRQKVVKYLIDWWLPAKKRQLVRERLIDMNISKTSEKKYSEIKNEIEPKFKSDQKKLKTILNAKSSNTKGNSFN